MKKALIAFILLFLLLTTDYGLRTVNAAVPHLLNYQGRLTDSSGVPLNGSYNLTFRIYDAETAGNLLWHETQSGVVIQKGIFSILLGSVTSLDLPFDKAYFLEIKVGDEVMSPRQRIASSGYAVRAEEAEKLGGKLPTDYALATDITATPTANKAVRLDSNAKLPATALKTYDSGWFAIPINTAWSKTHNLGTIKVVVQFLGANSSNGSGDNYVINPYYDFRPGSDWDKLSPVITATIISDTPRSAGVRVRDAAGNEVAINSLRVIMMALE